MSELKPIEVDVEEVRGRLTEMATQLEETRQAIDDQFEALTSTDEIDSEAEQFLTAALSIEDQNAELEGAINDTQQCLIDTLTNALAAAREHFEEGTSTVADAVIDDADAFNNNDQVLVDYIQALGAELESMVNDVDSEAETMASGLADTSNLVANTAKETIDTISQLADVLANDLGTRVTEEMGNHQSFVTTDAGGRIEDLTSKLSDTVSTSLEQFDERAMQAGDRLIEGAQNSVQSAIDHLQSNVAEKFSETAESFANDVAKAALTEAITTGTVMATGASLTTTLAPAIPALAGAKVATDAIKTVKSLIGG